jgi:phenylpropionate dioxygenase-like ring-hydroxylating dioxygenase large terminal subunit
VQCPYHAWSYGFDGALRNAPHTDEIEDFDPRCYGLRAVRVAVVEGLVMIDLSGTAPAPDEHVGDLAPALARYRSASLRRARGSSTTSTPTGRRSPRTTASACTARACIPSSTSSATTSRARR